MGEEDGRGVKHAPVSVFKLKLAVVVPLLLALLDVRTGHEDDHEITLVDATRHRKERVVLHISVAIEPCPHLHLHVHLI